MTGVVMFMFGGRKADVELQLPFVLRILDEHPEVIYHLWDLARNPEDSEYLQSLKTLHPHLYVMTQFSGAVEPWVHFDDVYRFYTDVHWREHLFVKLDDDVVFLETERWSNFIGAIESNPQAVVSAKVVNNGACAPHWPPVYKTFLTYRMRLLDWHLKAKTALMSHGRFVDYWQDMVNETPKVIPTKEWLSINVIGYHWEMGVRVAKLLGTRSPRAIAGRPFTPRSRLGDEGTVNTLPRIIYQGFTACHLYFGPQARNMSEDALWQLRTEYGYIGKAYLGG